LYFGDVAKQRKKDSRVLGGARVVRKNGILVFARTPGAPKITADLIRKLDSEQDVGKYLALLNEKPTSDR
jgi:hypothetical protein